MNETAKLLRETLQQAGVNARVQTYRNHEDISICPLCRDGWTEIQFEEVIKAIDAAGLVTLSQRVTGRKLVACNQVKGFRYLRKV